MKRSPPFLIKIKCSAVVVTIVCITTMTQAEDWPQWRGPNRDGIWAEKQTLQNFPPQGLKIVWQAAIEGGLSSPIVAKARVYVTDAHVEKPRAWERIHCFDEKSGTHLWTHSYPVNYPEYAFDPKACTGPYSTPVCDAGKVYALGILGRVICLDAATGTMNWEKDLTKEYGLGDYFTTPSLLVEGNLLILVIGGKPHACVVAVDKDSGVEIWRALDDKWTYSSPLVISAGGTRQLIVWTPDAVTSLDPRNGKIYWREKMWNEYAIVTPVFDSGRLLVSGVMFQLDRDKPVATVIWPEKRTASRMVLSQTSLPLLQGNYAYSNRVNGHLVCLEASTGKELWRTDDVTDQKNAASIHITPNGDSVLIFSDQGELIRARLSEKGYEEVSRVHLIDPTYYIYGRNVVWTPPAFANHHIFARNDRELICVSLAANP